MNISLFYMEEKTKIQKYIDNKKDIYNLFLSYIDDTQIKDFDLSKLEKFFKHEDHSVNPEELKQFLSLIVDISNNHHRTQNFFDKIKQILQFYSKLIKDSLSNFEIFDVFKTNKMILLYIIQNQIIMIDDNIYNEINGMIETNGTQYCHFFYPEIKSFLSNEKMQNIEKEILSDNPYFFDHFQENREKGENESYICILIRQDLVEEFISYITRTNIPLSSEIKASVFETNSFLIESKNISLIEYSAFYGSIQIFQFLKIKSIELTPSLWLFAIHSRNAELIHILERNIKFPINRWEKVYMEAIKCHHNEFAEYFINMFQIDPKMNDEIISYYTEYHNYSFFPSDFNESNEFFYLCYNNYTELVNLFMEKKDKEIKESIIEENKQAIQKAAEEDKTEILYYLLSKLTNIEDYLFSGIKGITRIALPPSITTIGESAFLDCSRLKLISIPSSVSSIKSKAFENCYSLKEITIPSSSIQKIQMRTFHKCVGLKKVTFPSSVKFICGFAFENCESLEKITITSNVQKIAIQAFLECYSLININISSLQSLNDKMFILCHALTKIVINSSITSINFMAFFQCISLKQVLFDANSKLTRIESYAFDECHSLEQITFPPSLKTIGDDVFHHCIGMKEVIFQSPSSLISIGKEAFLKCSSLSSISIPSSVTRINDMAFGECPLLRQISIPSNFCNELIS